MQRKRKPSGKGKEGGSSPSPTAPSPIAGAEFIDDSLSLFNGFLDCQDTQMVVRDLHLQPEEDGMPITHGTTRSPTKDGDVFTAQSADSASDHSPTSDPKALILDVRGSPFKFQVPTAPSSLPHMGPTMYENILSRFDLDAYACGSQIPRTNSVFSDHITAVEHCLRKSFVEPGALLHQGAERYVAE